MSEIATQVVDEKISSMKKKISEVSEIKSDVDTKMELLDKRLKRIEETMDKLESAIIQRVGDYAKGISEMKSELGMMQDSFSKALPRIVEKAKERKVKEKISKKKR